MKVYLSVSIKFIVNVPNAIHHGDLRTLNIHFSLSCYVI